MILGSKLAKVAAREAGNLGLRFGSDYEFIFGIFIFDFAIIEFWEGW